MSTKTNNPYPTPTPSSSSVISPLSAPLWTSPDVMLSSTVSWSTSLSAIAMTANGSSDSSPTDFAFEPPSVNDSTAAGNSVNANPPFKPDPIKTNSFSSTSSGISPSNGGFTPGGANSSTTYPFNGSFSSAYNVSTSSFSSASGSATGGSFSSVDALPAISRDFVRPSVSETRRPATAGGALQSRSPFAGFMPEDSQRFQRVNQRPTSSDGKLRVVEPIEEEGMFTNPFGTPKESLTVETKQVPSQTTTDSAVDPHYVSNNRRASEPQFVQNWQQPSYGNDSASLGLTSAPAPPVGFLQQQQQQQQMHGFARPNHFNGRPQTSDGLPSYPHLTGDVPLPSAQSIARQIPGMTGFYHPPTPISARDQESKGYMPFRDDRSASLGSVHPHNSFPGDRTYAIDSGLSRVGQGGAAIRSSYISTKPGDMSSELTFVQLGGPAPKKRPRRRYDEIERLYACGWSGCEKSYGTLNHLNAHVAMQKHGEKRLPSEFKDMRKAWRKKKREAAAAAANAQYAASAAAWTQRSSIGSSSTDSEWDRRDSSASMMSASSDFSHRSSQSYAAGYAPWSAAGAGGAGPGTDSRPSTSSSSISSVDGRSYFPPPQQAYGVNPALSGSANAYMNSINARRISAPQHLPMPAPLDTFRQTEDHPTPTAQNPFPQRAGFPFATLTSPMAAQSTIPVGHQTGGDNAYGGGQFAFQR